MSARSIGALLALVAITSLPLAACRKREPTRRIHVDVAEGIGAVQVTPAAISTRRLGNRVELEVARDVAIVVDAPGACPVTLSPSDESATLSALFDVPSDLPQVGWSAAFQVVAREACAKAKAGRFTWRVVEGDLHPSEASSNGPTFEARTPPFTLQTVPWGIVPISPRTRGAGVIEATWHGEDGATVVRTTRVAAAARATGVTSIATGQEILLGGSGWHVMRTTPKDAAPVLERVRDGLFRFRADQPSQIVLLDGAARPLSIRANKHERVPLDCGRSDCHGPATEAAQTSPMTHVLRNGFEGALGANYDPSCAVACHAVGEPGLDDGGFFAVKNKMGFAWPLPHAGAWEETPRALRRLGGVGCTSCHGPAAIPEPTARFAILRSDVCATCHDAPPRYGHMAAWLTSKMAASDRDATAASDPVCQRCHTTAGFLRTLSAAPREDAPRDAPVGIACAACHAPHSAHGSALLRDVKLSAAFDSLDSRSRICVPCHEGGAATVWAGAEGLRSPHANVGCTSCHMSQAAPSDAPALRGASHSFSVDWQACRTCHGSKVPALAPTLPKDDAGHASRMRLSPSSDAREMGRRAVREDRAAFVHNSRFAAMNRD